MTARQRQYLKLIIESYIEDGVPVGSANFINKYKLNVSSATVRNEMAILEKEKFLEKHHTSGGRIPSTYGFDYYAKNLAEQKKISINQKLKDIFAKRHFSIDLTLDEAASAISDLAGLTLVTSSNEQNQLLKSIHLTPLSKTAATIVIVTSTGRVESKLIELNKYVNIEDVRIAVRLFKERLVNSKLKDIAHKVEALSPILARSVKNYEAIIQAFISKVFDFHNRVVNKIYGNNELIKSNIRREDLAQLMDLMSKQSVWSSIEGKLDDDETMKIDIRNNNTSIISKKIITDKTSKEISVIGSNRMDYGEAKQTLLLLERFLKGTL